MWGKQCGHMYQLTSVFFLLPVCAGRNEWTKEDNCIQNPFVRGKWKLSRSLAKWRSEDQHQVVQYGLERKAKLLSDSSGPMSDGGLLLLCFVSVVLTGGMGRSEWLSEQDHLLSQGVCPAAPHWHTVSCLRARLMAKPYWNLRMSNPYAKMYCQAGCVVPCPVTRGATWLAKLFETTTSFGN